MHSKACDDSFRPWWVAGFFFVSFVSSFVRTSRGSLRSYGVSPFEPSCTVPLVLQAAALEI